MLRVMQEAQRWEELAKAEFQKVLKEKVQIYADKRHGKKSVSDLLKHCEEQKEMIKALGLRGGA